MSSCTTQHSIPAASCQSFLESGLLTGCKWKCLEWGDPLYFSHFRRRWDHALCSIFLAQTQECRDLCCVVLKDFPGFPSDVTPCLVLWLLSVLVKQYQSNDLGCRISLCCKAFFFVFFLHFEQMTAIKLLLHRSEYCLKHGWNVGSFTFSNGVFCNMSVLLGLKKALCPCPLHSPSSFRALCFNSTNREQPDWCRVRCKPKTSFP